MERKERARWLFRVTSWRMSCVSAARKKEWWLQTVLKRLEWTWESQSRDWERCEILGRQEEHGLPKELHEVLGSRSCFEREWCQWGRGGGWGGGEGGSQWVWPLQKIEIEEADVSSSGQKEYKPAVFSHGSCWLRSGGGTFHLGHPVLETRSLGVGGGGGGTGEGEEEWRYEQKEAVMMQVREVQMWRQVAGSAGTVMRETRDLGINWPYWHTLIFEGDRKLTWYMLLSKDVKKMLLQQVRKVNWKKWVAKHEYAELGGHLVGASSGLVT